MSADVVSVEGHYSTLDKAERVIVTVTGDPCYGEDCSGCCGFASVYLPIGDAVALRDRLDSVIAEAEQGER